MTKKLKTDLVYSLLNLFFHFEIIYLIFMEQYSQCFDTSVSKSCISSLPSNDKEFENCAFLQFSVKRWAEVIYSIIRDMHFTPFKTDPGIMEVLLLPNMADSIALDKGWKNTLKAFSNMFVKPTHLHSSCYWVYGALQGF